MCSASGSYPYTRVERAIERRSYIRSAATAGQRGWLGAGLATIMRPIPATARPLLENTELFHLVLAARGKDCLWRLLLSLPLVRVPLTVDLGVADRVVVSGHGQHGCERA